jgi:hypothetical protein
MLTCLTLAVLAGCTDNTLTAPDGLTASAAVLADRVDDLAVVTATDSSISLRWTQVADGVDRPALYRLKYATPSIRWATATVGCNSKGLSIGTPISCTVQGLDEATTYDFQLMSYRLVRGQWQGGVYSNVATGATAAPVAPPAPATPVAVTDLVVSAATRTSLTVSWTQVDGGTGAPANYRVKYSLPTMSWASATIGCDVHSVEGSAIGAATSCTIAGLESGTSYDVQLMSYRTDASGTWLDALRSNVATGATSQAPAGIWISAAELASRPTSGADWEQLLRDASANPGVADIGDQDSRHDVLTLAAAYVCVRTGQYCEKARRGVLDAMYTEEEPSDNSLGDAIPVARWMAVGRNLGSYIIAADLLDLRRGGSTGADGERVQEWLETFLTKQLMDSNSLTLRHGFEPFNSGANGAAQLGFAYAALAAYLRDRSALDFVWEGFRTFTCDRGATDVMGINLAPPVADGWTDPVNPCAVNPKGSILTVPSGLPGAGGTYRIDGALSADMRRGGVYQWTPGYTQYPWVGLEGLVPAAVILERAGYPAFAAGDQAVLRTHEYLQWLQSRTGDTRWFDGVRAREIVHLVNVFYDKQFPINQTIGSGRTVGYTGWSHQ